jgi:acetylornithine/N-succinyldiaminopimelate aminotransferase
MAQERSEDALVALAAQAFSPTYAPLPFIAHKGEGTLLWSKAGKRYIDFTCGIGVNALGHAHPAIVEAIANQASLLCHTSNMFLHENGLNMAEKISELAFFGQVFLTNSGTEAIEAAIKLVARYFANRDPKRTKLVSTLSSFHGRSLGSLRLTGQSSYHEGYASLVKPAQWIEFGNFAALEEAIDESTMALCLEPIQGNAGVRIAPPGYLQAARQICDRSGALLIFDEVQTGMGRTGRWFAHQHENVTPDILTLAKALGGGLPLGAILAPAHITKTFKIGSHGSTFGGNPVACAAGLAMIDFVEKNKLLEHTISQSKVINTKLKEIEKRRSKMIEFRQRGYMIGIESTIQAKDLRQRCYEKGLLVTTSGPTTIRILPPLNASIEHFDEAWEILEQALAAA